MTLENLKHNKTKKMLIRISPVKKSQIDAIADELGLSSSQLVSLSIDDFIKRLS